MTSNSTTETDSPLNDPRISFLDGHWIDHDQMRVPVDDAGFRQGVTAVERLRTYGGRIFAIEEHLDRWQHSVGALQISGLPTRNTLPALLQHLITRNDRFVGSEQDVGITMFATPGSSDNGTPTFGLHLSRLNHATIRRRRDGGQPLMVAPIQQPSPNSWPRSIKVRSRIHYYLADRFARQHDCDAVGVLVDDDGSVTETSIANVAIVRSGQIVSPPSDRVLGGITQAICQKLASQTGIRWSHDAVTREELVEADEVLMLGTDGGIWFANSVDAKSIAKGVPGNVYLTLRQEFDQLVNEA